MTDYVIGDVHGCYASLCRLLERIAYHPRKDNLWFTGDLIGRGPQPLHVLKRLREMHAENARLVIVLGNHDLHLIALALGPFEDPKQRTTDRTLDAVFKEDGLIDWLRHLPLLHYDARRQMVLTHAGIPPIWTLAVARAQSHKMEAMLRQPRNTLRRILPQLYGDQPNNWQACQTAVERCRMTINYLTRMRFCTAQGELDLQASGLTPPGERFAPWFTYPSKIKAHQIFGHWAALKGQTGRSGFWNMDYGCAWGRFLGARRLDDGKVYLVAATENQTGQGLRAKSQVG